MSMRIFINAVFVFLSVSLLLLSCRKVPLVLTQRKTIHVADVNQLYAAVNDSANAGVVIILAPGTYTLASTKLNAGRLEFQQDMDLQGQEGNSELVIIDESALPVTSFAIPPSFRTGGIRMGRGSNAISWLTVKGNPSSSALSNIDTDLTWSGIIRIRVSHIISKEGQNGLDVRNPGFAGENRVIEADIDHNEFVNNNIGASQGMEIQNANGSTGSIIRANLNINYVHGNNLGMRSFNTATSNGSIKINSTSDRFEDNGTGCSLTAGASTSQTAIANDNIINFHAFKTIFRNNHGPSLDGTPAAGIFAAGGFSAVAANSTSNNKLEIGLSGCLFTGNQGVDMNAFGAYSKITTLAGKNNSVKIYIVDAPANVIVQSTASLPAEPGATNVVSVFKY
ncbi:MAG: hypothetical protein ABIN89_26020 [Chitinophagaceae bacterium]